ncbi:unnamed protein product, partial [Parnassius apollo]
FFALKTWFLEYQNFTYGLQVHNLKTIGHYTQMVWATSHKIGCGLAHCPGGPWGHFYNYVCHYCPGGNYDTITQYPYKGGPPCGDCPQNCVQDTLCTNACPRRDYYSNCNSLYIPNFCFYSIVFPSDRTTCFPPPLRLRPNCNATADTASGARALRRRPPYLASTCRRVMVCDDGLHAPSPHVRRKSLRRLASTRGFKIRTSNEHGWIRVFDGLEPFAVECPSKLVKISKKTTVEEVNKKLGLSNELTLWLQTGGENSRRLEPNECPLQIQENFLMKSGWISEARRLRLAVDPELRHTLRWCAGPSGTSGGVLQSGTIHLLKGHVFPQWKPRNAYILGSRLYTYGVTWDVLELSGGSIELCQPKAQKLVVCVKPRSHGNSLLESGVNHLFLGFNTVWERNMWFCWLKEKRIMMVEINVINSEESEIDSLDVFNQQYNEDIFLDSLEPSTFKGNNENGSTQSTQPPNILDLSGGGRSSLEAVLTQHASNDFAIRVLRMRSSALSTLPPQTCTLTALTHLDISDNRISELPAEICQLTQ